MTSNPHKRKRIGATLLELVSALTIISGSTGTILVGTKYYANHTDRSQCLVNLSDIQKAVRHHQNTKMIKVGTPLDLTQLVGPGKSLHEDQMKCPTNMTPFQLLQHYPPSGISAAKCVDFDSKSGKLDPSKNHSHNHNYKW